MPGAGRALRGAHDIVMPAPGFKIPYPLDIVRAFSSLGGVATILVKTCDFVPRNEKARPAGTVPALAGPPQSGGTEATDTHRPSRCDAMQASMNAMVCAPSSMRGYASAGAGDAERACDALVREVGVDVRERLAQALGMAARRATRRDDVRGQAGSPRPITRAASPCSDSRR